MRPYTSMVKPKNRRVLLLILIVFSISTAALFFIRGGLDSCGGDRRRNGPPDSVSGRVQLESPLEFMRSKLVLLVSHELSLSGGPLLLMELAFLLKSVGAQHGSRIKSP